MLKRIVVAAINIMMVKLMLDLGFLNTEVNIWLVGCAVAGMQFLLSYLLDGLNEPSEEFGEKMAQFIPEFMFWPIMITVIILILTGPLGMFIAETWLLDTFFNLPVTITNHIGVLTVQWGIIIAYGFIALTGRQTMQQKKKQKR